MAADQENTRSHLEQVITLEDALQELPERVVFEVEVRARLDRILEEVASNNADKPYHNQEHAATVMQRSFRIWRSLQEIASEQFDDRGYELLAFAAAGHDLFQDYKTPGENELRSAEAVVLFMDGLYDEHDKERVYDAVIATTVRRSVETGVIEQLYLKDGSRDPLKFVLSVADTNGIALEGPRRMVNDAVKLFMEFNGVSGEASFLENSKELGKFLMLQAGFLGARLESLPEELAYFFPGDDSQRTNAHIVKKMEELLYPGVAAFSVAQALQVPARIETFVQVLSSQPLAVKDAAARILELLHISQ